MSEVIELDAEKFNASLRKPGRLNVVEFYTDSCPNCKAMEPVFRDLAGELSDNALFAKINAGREQGLARLYGVMGVPTFKFFCGHSPVGEIVGAVNATILRNTVRDFIVHKKECSSKTTKIYDNDGYG